MNHMLPITPLYGPTGTIVRIASIAATSARDDGRLVILVLVAAVLRYATCPLLSTVSRGNFVNSSTRLSRKEEKLDVAGVEMGSMWKKERKKRGPEVERKVGSAVVRKVIGAREGGTRREGRARREGRRVRGCEERGVRINLL